MGKKINACIRIFMACFILDADNLAINCLCFFFFRNGDVENSSGLEH